MKRAFLWILLSVVVINGSALMGLSYFRYRKSQQRHDAAYMIVALVQTSLHHELLKSGHIPELLGLSVDHPINLFDFDAKEAEKKLKDTVAIKQAVVKKIRPGTLHVEYVLRQPIAFVGNYTNTVIDGEGIMFPLKPFYTPKKIPIVFFDDASFTGDDNIWGSQVQGSNANLIFKILEEAPKTLGNRTNIVAIDLSKAQAPSFGQRHIILTLEETEERIVNSRPIIVVSKRTLRLFPDNWELQLANYTNLRSYLNDQLAKKITSAEKAVFHAEPLIIDLRLTNLAFISP